MSNLEKMNVILLDDPDLAEQVAAEITRLVEGRNAVGEEEALIRAVRTVLGIELTAADLAVPAAGG